jgi:putative NADH-flavin reductase
MVNSLTGRKIAIVGASGKLGRPTLNQLLSKGVHTITAIQRDESTSRFSSEVVVKKGSFVDESFLVRALEG